MPFFRVNKTKDYTIMANHHLKNRDLSLKAKGLLSVMLSLPEDWHFTVHGLASICKEGRDSISGAVRELEEAGYIVRHRLRDKEGHINGLEYIIYETPQKPENNGPDGSKTPVEVEADTEEAEATEEVDTPSMTESRMASPVTEKPFMEEVTAIPEGKAPRTAAPRSASPITENPLSARPMSERPSLLLNTNRVNTKEPKTKSLTTQVTNPSYPSYPSNQEQQDKVEQVRQEVRQQVCYDVLDQSVDQELLDELVGLIVETLCDKARTIRIGSHDYPAELVQERMRQIDSFCLEYVCACLRKSNPSIRNIKQYLLMALFNAPVTMSHYYYNKAQNALNDWYTGGIANEN